MYMETINDKREAFIRDRMEGLRDELNREEITEMSRDCFF